MPRLFAHPALGSVARCSLAAILAGALGCMNDAPLATTDATAGLRFSANVVSAAGRTIKIAVMYRRSLGETVRVLATPTQIPLEPGATVNQDVTVDLAGCLKDGDRLPADTPGCQLMVELTLLDEAGNTVDTQVKQAPGAPTAPGQVVEFGSVTIGIQVGSVAVEPTSVQLNVTQTQELEAVVKDAAGASLTNTTVTWTAGDPSIIRLSSATGARVTVTGVKLGSTTLTASSGGKSSPPIPVTVAPLDPLSVSPASASVEAGATVQLTVANPSGVISWQSSDEAVASVDQNGLVRGVQPRDNDPVTITATTGSGDTQRTGTARITVTSAPPLVIDQRPGPGCVIVGQSVTLTVASPPAAVSWVSEHQNIATIDASSGVVRGVSAGQATIRATSDNRTGTAPVCVVGPLGNVPQTLDLTAGQTAQLSPSGTSNANVGYSSDNTAVATVSGSGLITGLGIGQARITTKLTAASGSEEVQTVVAVNAAAITIEPNPVSVAAGARQALKATARDANGNPIDGVTFTWTVDDQTTAKLPQTSGNPVEVEGVKLGATSVRVTGGGASGAVQVTVTRGAPASITVTLNDSSLTVGQEGVTATAEVKDAAGNVLNDQTVSWTTSDPKVATASGTGPRTATVAAIGAGGADVIAAVGDVSGHARVTVAPSPPASISLTPTTASLTVGQTIAVTAIVKDAQGNTITTLPNDLTLIWQSSTATVASATATAGEPFQADVKALTKGSTNVTAALVLSGGSTVTSNAVAVTVDVLEPAVITKVAGDNTDCAVHTSDCRFTVKVTNTDGVPVPGAQVQWKMTWKHYYGEYSGTCEETVTNSTDAQGLASASNVCQGTPPNDPECSTACDYTMTATLVANGQEVSFKFDITGYLLFVRETVDATGSGVVKSQQGVTPGLNCEITAGSIGSTGCFVYFAPNTQVTLTATAASGSQFAGWGEQSCDEGGGTQPNCTVSMNEMRSVTPRFVLPTPTKIEKVSGDNSTCPVKTFNCSFTVRVTNAANQPVSGVVVDWTWPVLCDDGVPVSTTTNAEGLATWSNCSYTRPGVYQQVATVKGTAISTTFTYTQSGLVLTFLRAEPDVPEAGKVTWIFDVTAVGVVANDLHVEVGPRGDQPGFTVTSATFNQTTTPAVLRIVGLSPPGASGIMNLIVSSSTPGVTAVTGWITLNYPDPFARMVGATSGASTSRGGAMNDRAVGGSVSKVERRVRSPSATRLRPRAQPNR